MDHINSVSALVVEQEILAEDTHDEQSDCEDENTVWNFISFHSAE
jgi:hypothetical protein